MTCTGDGTVIPERAPTPPPRTRCYQCCEDIAPDPLPNGWIACDNCGAQWRPADSSEHAQLVEVWRERDAELLGVMADELKHAEHAIASACHELGAVDELNRREGIVPAARRVREERDEAEALLREIVLCPATRLPDAYRDANLYLTRRGLLED